MTPIAIQRGFFLKITVFGQIKESPTVCIYQSKHDVKNVVFRNNSVGFAQASWSEHLGCCVIQMGFVKTSTWEDVHFQNIEVYKTSCSLLSIFNRANNASEGGKIKDIYFENISAKYVEQTNLLVYCLSVVIRLLEGATWQNSTIGALYLDNITYAGTQITEDNYKEYTKINAQNAFILFMKNFPYSSES